MYVHKFIQLKYHKFYKYINTTLCWKVERFMLETFFPSLPLKEKNILALI